MTPATNCPRASPMRQAVTVSCAMDVAASSSTVKAGSTGRYRSIEIGPNTVSKSSSAGTNRPTGRCGVDEGILTPSSKPRPSDPGESLLNGVPAGHP